MRHVSLSAAVVGSTVLLAVPTIHAAPVVYTTASTGGPTNFDSLTWSPSGTPGADPLDVANFNNSSALTVSLNGSRSLGSIGRLASNATTINQSSSSDTITLNSSGTSTSAGLDQAQLLKTSNGSLTINAPIILGANATWANTNTSGIITVNSTLTDGASTYSLRKIGTGTILINPGLSAVVTGVTHDGGTKVEAGTLQWGDGTASSSATTSFGTGAIDLAGGTFDVRWGGGYTLTNPILGNGGTINSRRGDGHKISGGIALNSQITVQTGGGGGTPAYNVDSTITVEQTSSGTRRFISNVSSNGPGYITGNIVDGAGSENNALTIRVIGSRNLELRGTSNSYDGGTIVESATSGQTQRTLVVDAASKLGSGNVTVQAQGGTIPTLGSNGYAGMLQLNGNNTIDPSATLSIETGGLVTLNFSNAVTGTQDSSDLLLSGLVLGGIAQSPGVYNSSTHPAFFGGTGEIVVIPEPALMSMIGLGFFSLIRRRCH